MKAPMDDLRHGLKATIIDLGFSRMGEGNGKKMIHWTPIDDDVFEGEGDYQFEVYRIMKELSLGDWETFRPFSNVIVSLFGLAS
jgi:serine/threonine-protein kinase haspin